MLLRLTPNRRKTTAALYEPSPVVKSPKRSTFPVKLRLPALATGRRIVVQRLRFIEVHSCPFQVQPQWMQKTATEFFHPEGDIQFEFTARKRHDVGEIRDVLVGKMLFDHRLISFQRRERRPIPVALQRGMLQAHFPRQPAPLDTGGKTTQTIVGKSEIRELSLLQEHPPLIEESREFHNGFRL